MWIVKRKPADLVALAAATITFIAIAACPFGAFAESASEIDRNASESLITLYNTTPGAKALADKSKGLLIFPNIVKGGFIIGGQYGNGALRENVDHI